MRRKPNRTVSGQDFDEKTIEAVWQKAKEDPGYTVFKKDACGASIKRGDYGTTGTQGWEIDHINPVSNGGTDDLGNLQPLHWENNRHKGDNYPDWSCKGTS